MVVWALAGGGPVCRANQSLREFGALLREHRVAVDLTQEALAQRSGVSPRTIQHLEASDVRPTRATLESLVRALELAPAARSRFEAAATRRPRGGVAGDGGAIRAPASNLLAPRTALIGREHEVAALSDLVGQGEARLVTLTGVGGVRQDAAGPPRGLRPAGPAGPSPDGVWLVELAPLADPALVPQAVAAPLGVRGGAGRAPAGRPGRLPAAAGACCWCWTTASTCSTPAPRLAEPLLDACPALRILATSREPLRVAGEQQLWRRALLARRPTRRHAVAGRPGRLPGGASSSSSAREAVAPDFRLTARERRRRRPGLRAAGRDPAGPRAGRRRGCACSRPSRSPPGWTTRFRPADRREPGGADAPADAAGDARLEPRPAHGAGASRCSGAWPCFAGGCDLEAAEAVASDPAEDEPAPPAGRGRCSAGLRCSICSRGWWTSRWWWPSPGGTALRARGPVPAAGAAAPVRPGAAGRAPGRRRAVGRRHAAHYLALAEQAEPGWYGPAQTAWLDRLEREHDNLRAALRYWFDRGDAAHALRLGAALWWFWFNRGHWAEGHRWLTDLLALPGAGDFPAAYAQALVGAARLGGDAATGRALVAQAAALWRGLREQQGAADERARPALAFWAYAFVHAAALSGDPAAERGLGAQAAALWRSLGDPRQVAAALSELGLAARNRGEPGPRAPGSRRAWLLPGGPATAGVSAWRSIAWARWRTRWGTRRRRCRCTRRAWPTSGNWGTAGWWPGGCSTRGCWRSSGARRPPPAPAPESC